jgi:hypothetical protein
MTLVMSALNEIQSADGDIQSSPKNLGEVATSRCWVGDREADDFLGVDDEDRADLPTYGIGSRNLWREKENIGRTVKGSPFESRFVASCSSSMS